MSDCGNDSGKQGGGTPDRAFGGPVGCGGRAGRVGSADDARMAYGTGQGRSRSGRAVRNAGDTHRGGAHQGIRKIEGTGPPASARSTRFSAMRKCPDSMRMRCVATPARSVVCPARISA